MFTKRVLYGQGYFMWVVGELCDKENYQGSRALCTKEGLSTNRTLYKEDVLTNRVLHEQEYFMWVVGELCDKRALLWG